MYNRKVQNPGVSALRGAPLRPQIDDTKRHNIFSYLLEKYGGTKIFLDISENALQLANSAYKGKKYRRVFQLSRYISPTVILGADLISSVKEFYKGHNSRETVYEKKAKFALMLLGFSKKEIESKKAIPQLSESDCELGKEIFTWLFSSPKTEHFSIVAYHSLDEAPVEEILKGSRGTIILELKFMSKVFLWEISFVSINNELNINHAGVICEDKNVKLVPQLKAAITKDFLSHFDISKNVVTFNQYLGYRPRHQRDEFVNQINVEDTLLEIKSVLKNGRKRGLGYVGPPGTGKSTILKVIERKLTEYPVIHLSPVSFGSSLDIRETFKMIRRIQPCVCFLEDLCSYGFESKKNNQRLCTFLEEIDDVNNNLNVVFITTINETNLVHESILNRPGRFDEIRMITAPSKDVEVYEVMKARYDKNKSYWGYAEDQPFLSSNEIYPSIFQNIIKERYTQADICEIVEKAFIEADVLKLGCIEVPALLKSVDSLKRSKEAIKACNFSVKNVEENDPCSEDACEPVRAFVTSSNI